MAGLTKILFIIEATSRTTLLEENANDKRATKDKLNIAKSNQKLVCNEATKRKRLYATLKGKVAEFMEETGNEPTNIIKLRDDAKKDLKEIKTELEESKEKYSTAVENYKRAFHNNLAARYKEEKTPELKIEVKIQKKRFKITKGDIKKAKDEIRELKIKQNSSELLDVSDDDNNKDNNDILNNNGLFVD
ncbi:hypothetical protein V494_08343 [Pseudogymnoascus sp. VKM F-4513 (FW-928)]|nr:hypothetical protein V494_08343 [Pseudogymnoascus sp. VKM F-4513 (FW-928)]